MDTFRLIIVILVVYTCIWVFIALNWSF